MIKKLTGLLLSVCMVAACVFPQGITGTASAADSDSSEADPLMQEVYQAEDASLSKADTGDSLDDFSADGYVDSIRSGGSITFTVIVPQTGNYGVRLRYTNGSEQTTGLSYYANDVKVGTAQFAATVNWNTWDVQLVNISLTEGVNTITLKNEQSTTFETKLDKISLSFLYEAEDALHLGNMADNTDHAGYSGTGFAAGFQRDGQGVQYNVNLPEGGEYSLVLRYAAGDTDSASQSVSVYINGERTQQLLASMRSWDIWSDSIMTVNLNEGDNEIVIKKTSDDDGQINLDYITVKQEVWEYAGAVKSVSGSGSSELNFTCDNAVVRIDSVDENTLKIWADPEGKFERKYESFTVVNDAVNPQKLTLSDKGDYYQFTTGDLVVRVYKDPCRIVYLDQDGNVILENDEQSMGWTSDGELTVNNKLQSDEQFWGLGEKLTDFNRRGQELVMWSQDAYGAEPDSSVPSWDNGRWYMANPYFTSSKGYAILFDNSSRTVFDLGGTSDDTSSFSSLNPNPGGDLIYYFIYGPSQKQLVSSYSDIAGKSFFAPEWAYGNIQCHYGYTQEDIEEVAETYREKNIPIDVIMADIEWYEYLCSPTTWSSANFPDPEGMLELLDSLNIKMGLINDPNITNRDSNADFTAGDLNGYFVKDQTGSTKLISWPWGGASGLTDFFNPNAQAWWGSLLNNVLNQGVACFWLDMNEPAKYNTDWLFYNEDGKAYGTLSEVKNAYALKHQEAVYNKVTETGDRAFLLTRSGYSGTQRYASPWTGDIQGSYESMHEQITLGTSLSMSGYNYWGFDIGGFFSSVSDDQYKRWVELSTFTPVHRFHYANGVEAKEPWTHNSEDVSKKYINLRYTLEPYMYSYTADNIIGIGIEKGYGEGGTGIPLVRSMVLEYSDDANTYDMDTQYMCGQSFLVAPVVENSTTKDVYLPEGYWYDYDDGYTVYSGNQTLEYDAPSDLLPVFVKEGSIIPMQSERQYMDDPTASPDITLDVYPTVDDGSFNFVLYEDDGETEDYQNGEYATTPYDCTVDRGDATDTMTLNIGARTTGYTDIDSRNYLIQFHNSSYNGLTVKLGDTMLNAVDSLDALSAVETGYYADKSTGLCTVKIPDTAQDMVLTLTGDSGTNNDMTYEAEDATLTGCIAQNATVAGQQATVVTGLTTGSSVTLNDITVAEEGDYGIEVVYTAGGTDKTITLSSGESSCTLSAEAAGYDTAAGVLHLQAGENTIQLTANDSTLGIDKTTVSRKSTVVSAASNYSVNAVSGSLIGSAAIGSDGTGVSLTGTNDGVSLSAVCVGSGTYSVRLSYTSDAEAAVQVTCGNSVQTVTLPAAKNNSLMNEVTVNLSLTAGPNTILVTKLSGGTVSLNTLTWSLDAYTTRDEIANAVTNAGFESGDLTGWTLTDSNGSGSTDGYGVDGYDTYSGDRKLYLYNSSAAINKTLSQVVTGLDDGYYIVKLKTKLYNNASASLAQVQLFSGSAAVLTDIGQTSGEWETTSTAPILVTGGSLTISVAIDAPAACSLQLDDFEIYKASASTSTVSTEYLSTLIDEAQNYSAKHYSEDAWLKYTVGAALAKRLVDSDSYTADQILGYVSYLTKAKTALEAAVTILEGDVDRNQSVTVSDVVELRDVIMKANWSNDVLIAGDLDGNDTLTVSDVVALRSLIMAGIK